MAGPSRSRITGVVILLASCTFLGVGLHHLIQTGTCSSSGYNQYGPTQVCPKGTGIWLAFVVAGIFGSFLGIGSGAMAVIAAVFGAVGLAAVTVVLESNVSSSNKLFAGIFGGCFLLVDLGLLALVISTARESSPEAGAAGAQGAGAAGLPGLPATSPASGIAMPAGGAPEGSRPAGGRWLVAVLLWCGAVAGPFLLGRAVAPKSAARGPQTASSSSAGGARTSPAAPTVSPSDIKGGAPQSLYHTANLARVLGAVRAKLGPAASVSSLQIYPGFLTVQVAKGAAGFDVYAGYNGQLDVSRQSAPPAASGGFPLDTVAPELPETMLARIAAGAHIPPRRILYLSATPTAARLSWRIYVTPGTPAAYFTATGTGRAIREILLGGSSRLLPGA